MHTITSKTILTGRFRMTEWTKDAVRALAQDRVITVTFKKKNGDTRIMDCTLLEKFLPVQLDIENTTTRDNPDVLAVWDITSEGWRSFRIDSIIAIENSPRAG